MNGILNKRNLIKMKGKLVRITKQRVGKMGLEIGMKEKDKKV
jgi:hypothetical protein